MLNYLTVLLCLMTSFTLSAQDQQYNQRISNERTGEEILVGKCNRDVFSTPPYRDWFNFNYPNYLSSKTKSILDSCKAMIDSVRISIVLATWCKDSHKHFPPFLAYLDYLKFKNFEIICVNIEKKAAGLSIEDLEILFVPTFIFYHGEKEAGRIIEHPEQSLETDMLRILQSSFKQE